MRCRKPITFRKISNEVAFPCGLCMPCRINRRRIWAHRIINESYLHDHNTFLTLTYDDDHLPDEFTDPDTGQIYAPNSVSPLHHTNFLKRLRIEASRKIGIKKIRFYGVGEYGDKTQRPHYHYALFGYPTCINVHKAPSSIFKQCQCPNCQFIHTIWGKGNVLLGTLTSDSAHYIADYVTKALTNDSDFRQLDFTGPTNADRLDGRHPEFSRMSRNSGIGSEYIKNLSRVLTPHVSTDTLDTITTISHGIKSYPLGRYQTKKLYEAFNVTLTPKEKIKKFASSMRSLFKDVKNPEILKASGQSVAYAIEMLNAQKCLNLAAQLKSKRKEKSQ